MCLPVVHCQQFTSVEALMVDFSTCKGATYQTSLVKMVSSILMQKIGWSFWQLTYLGELRGSMCLPVLHCQQFTRQMVVVGRFLYMQRCHISNQSREDGQQYANVENRLELLVTKLFGGVVRVNVSPRGALLVVYYSDGLCWSIPLHVQLPLRDCVVCFWKCQWL